MTYVVDSDSRIKEDKFVFPMPDPEFRCDIQSPWEQDPHLAALGLSRLRLKQRGRFCVLAFFRA